MMSKDDKTCKFDKEAMHAFFRVLSANHGGPHKTPMPDNKNLEPGDRVRWHLAPGMPYPEMKIVKFQTIVDDRYQKLKEKYGYGGTQKAFEELKQQLIQERKNPEKYGLNNDAYAFNRAYNKRKNKKLRE